jgi:hypothetical protein
LNVRPDAPVYFSYASTAGAAGATPDDPWTDINASRPTPWLATTDVWYVVKAAADLNGDGKKQAFVGSSFTSEIFVENEGE